MKVKVSLKTKVWKFLSKRFGNKGLKIKVFKLKFWKQKFKNKSLAKCLINVNKPYIYQLFVRIYMNMWWYRILYWQPIYFSSCCLHPWFELIYRVAHVVNRSTHPQRRFQTKSNYIQIKLFETKSKVFQKVAPCFKIFQISEIVILVKIPKYQNLVQNTSKWLEKNWN